jgi:hypothetical protein
MKHVAIVGSRSRTDVETVERLVATLASDTVWHRGAPMALIHGRSMQLNGAGWPPGYFGRI